MPSLAKPSSPSPAQRLTAFATRALRRRPLLLLPPVLLALLLLFAARPHPPPAPSAPPSPAILRVTRSAPPHPPPLRIVIVSRGAGHEALATLRTLRPAAWGPAETDVLIFGNATAATRALPGLRVVQRPPRPFEAVLAALADAPDQPTLYLEAGTLLAPAALTWLHAAHAAYAARPDVAGFLLDGARPRVKADGPDHLPASWRVVRVPDDTPAFMYRLCVAGTAFMPNHAPDHTVWATFAEWLTLRRVDWYRYPSGPGVDATPLGMSDLPERNWTRGAWNVWFSKFVNEYQLSLVYPNMPSGAVLARNPVLDRSRDMRETTSDLSVLHVGTVNDNFTMGEAIPHYDASGQILDGRTVSNNAANIAALARDQGGMVSFTMVNKVFLETARSWLCNVDVAGFRPKGLLWAVTDDETRTAMQEIPESHTILLQGIQGGKETGHEFGNPGYWKLMLERTQLIGDILRSGTAVFAFETDAIWLEDPTPYIEELVRQEADIVGTINTRTEVSGNFFYLRPTLATRRLWNEITSEFEKAYVAAKFEKKSATSWTYIENDQSMLTKLVLRNDTWRRSYPLSFLTLDTERFTDGRWYKPEEGFYTSARARKPVMINNNFVIGVSEKTTRAKKWGHWFWDETKQQCLRDVVQKAIADPLKEERSSAIVEGHDGAHSKTLPQSNEKTSNEA